MNSTPLTTSPAGLALIEGFEEFRSVRYPDLGGIWTIGYGHVIKGAEASLLWNATLTKEQATEILHSDVHTVELYLNATTIRPGCSQNQFDALVSLAFNIGLGNFESSTLRKRYLMGNLTAAAQQFVAWNKVRDPHTKMLVDSDGLLHRRLKEQALFLGRLA